MLVQPVFVTLFYLLGKANPSIGAVLGGVIGLGISAYMIELLLFLIGMWLFQRLGMSARVLFLAHFDRQILKETFSFGIFEMLGSLIISAGAALEIWITQYRLINYTEIWGNWGLAQNFIFAFTVSTNLYDGTMPAISEAISNGKKKLCQYYSAQSYKWGALTSAFLAAVLLAIAPRFILGASGPDFERAARYVLPLILFGSLQYLTWSGDSIMLGANRPRIRAVMILMEQAIRILLIFILLPYLQVTGLVVAYLVGIAFRGVVTYFVNNRVAFPQRFFIWQSAVAPLLAGALHFLWLNGLASLVWKGDEITSLLLFLIGLLFSLPIFLFIYSLVGGWDSAGLAEFQESKNLTGFLKGIIDILFWKPIKLGARLSPLTNRFPISIYQAAQEEAAELTLQKVKL
jgi:O-antigen/teichoic acid export membrane protein